MYFALFIIFMVFTGIFLKYRKHKLENKRKEAFIHQEFPAIWRSKLKETVPFYLALDEEHQKIMEEWILRFLAEKTITPIQTTISDIDKLFIATSAIIPVFAFPFYVYPNLNEIIVYPTSFNENYELEGPNRAILGMVGTGVMEGKMLLDKQALEYSFLNQHDKQHVAIHEFVHLIDKLDGSTDGIPEFLLQHKLVAPWLELIKKETKAIFENKSDINPYAVTNNAEFFAVVSEYFFKQPHQLKSKHPELYKELSLIFQQTPSYTWS